MGLDNFSAALDLLIGFEINLYVGDEVVKGKLMGVETDHIILEDEKNYIFYYSKDKVHAITKNTRHFQGEEPKGNFQKTKSLTELLQSFRNSWISILSANKKRFSGVLSDIDEDFATLINGDERILIKLSHISNILKGFIVEEEAKIKEMQEDKQECHKKEDSDKEKSKSSSTDSEKEDKKESHKKEDSDKKKSKSSSTDSEKEDKQECHKKEDSDKKKSKSSSTDSEKKHKHQSEEQAHASVKKEEETKLGWSEPIKPITDSYTSEKEKKEIKPGPPVKPIEFMKDHTIKDSVIKNNEETRSQKEEKTEKEETMKVEKITTTPMTKKEVKPTKSQEANHVMKKETKSMKASEAAPLKQEVTPAKTSSAHKNEMEHHNNRNNVWKPRGQEEKAYRFAGEPVSREEIRAFPFAGWPNRKSKSSRNLFF